MKICHLAIMIILIKSLRVGKTKGDNTVTPFYIISKNNILWSNHPVAPFSYILTEPQGSFFIPFSKEVTQNVREFRLKDRS